MNLITTKPEPTDAARPSPEPPLLSLPLSQLGAPPMVVTSHAPSPRVMRLFNPVVRALLRSPVHGLLSRQVFLLTVTGRRSGRRFTLPLGYVPDADGLLVISQHSDQKRWWRNLRGGAPVALHLRGRRLTGRAEAIETPLAAAAEIERVIARLGPKEASARLYLGLDTTPPLTREQLARALDGVVLVRITPDGPGGSAAVVPVPARARRDTLRKVLLGCGVLSSVLYVVATTIPYDGYSPVSQNVSELLAVGAPTRLLMLIVLVGAYNALVVALAAGVWLSAGRRRLPQLLAGVLVAYALLGALGGGIFNMDMRGAVSTPRGALHPTMTAVGSVPILLSLVLGLFLHGRRFALLSLAVLLAGAVGGALTVQDVPLLAANLPTPWMGVKERINIFAYMLWLAVLALSFWPSRGRSSESDKGAR